MSVFDDILMNRQVDELRSLLGEVEYILAVIPEWAVIDRASMDRHMNDIKRAIEKKEEGHGSQS